MKHSTSNTAQSTLIPKDTSVVVRVVFLYVAQGSSILVLFREKGVYCALLVDSNLGTEANGIDIPKLMKDLLGDESLYAFVNTHPHSDHLQGIKDLSEAVNIERVWHANHKPSKKYGEHYNELLDLIAKIEKKDTSKVRILDGSRESEDLGDARLHILAPAEHVTDDVNEEEAEARYARIHENCAVFKVGDGTNWVMITGDADLVAFREHITDYHKDRLGAYVLDASHHGSRSFFMKEEGDEPYLDHIEAIRPSHVIISAPERAESRHKHPHKDAVKLYKKYATVHHMGPDRECFICDIHDNGVADAPVTDDGKLVDAYGLEGDGNGDNDGSGGGGGGGDVKKSDSRGPFVRPSAPSQPRDVRYA